MHDERSQETYSIRFDERRESWYLAIPNDLRLGLDRTTLAHLISLYNEIHHGNPLTLIERRVLEKLSSERCDLQDTIRNLYDFIDNETAPPFPPGTPDHTGPAQTHQGKPLLAHVRHWITNQLERIHVI